jgi:hypothetical protein
MSTPLLKYIGTHAFGTYYYDALKYSQSQQKDFGKIHAVAAAYVMEIANGQLFGEKYKPLSQMDLFHDITLITNQIKVIRTYAHITDPQYVEKFDAIEAQLLAIGMNYDPIYCKQFTASGYGVTEEHYPYKFNQAAGAFIHGYTLETIKYAMDHQRKDSELVHWLTPFLDEAEGIIKAFSLGLITHDQKKDELPYLGQDLKKICKVVEEQIKLRKEWKTEELTELVDKIRTAAENIAKLS